MCAMLSEKELSSRLRNSLQAMLSTLDGVGPFCFVYSNANARRMPHGKGEAAEKRTDMPTHAGYFTDTHIDWLASCPHGCCMALPVLDGLLILGTTAPMDAPTAAIARLLLNSLAREAERDELIEQVAFGERSFNPCRPALWFCSVT